MPGDDHPVRRPGGAVLNDLPARPNGPVRSFDTAELFGGDVEIEITHQQAVYRLKITRQGKLILNK